MSVRDFGVCILLVDNIDLVLEFVKLIEVLLLVGFMVGSVERVLLVFNEVKLYRRQLVLFKLALVLKNVVIQIFVNLLNIMVLRVLSNQFTVWRRLIVIAVLVRVLLFDNKPPVSVGVLEGGVHHVLAETLSF